MFSKKSHTFISCFILVLLAACGKQGPTKTPFQKAEGEFADLSEKYKDEVALVSEEQDEDKKINGIGKIVLKKKFEVTIWNRLDPRRAPDKIPFTTYQSYIATDIQKLKSIYQTVSQSDPQLASEVQELSDMLYVIKKCVEQHHEFRSESRYLAGLVG